MTERPMLFSGPMVRALLREIAEPGTGKTQTRRVLTQRNVTVLGERWGKNGPWSGLRFNEATMRERSPISGAIDANLAVPFCHPEDEPEPTDECGVYRICPIVQPGDHFWVRESIDRMAQAGDQIAYRADWPGDARGLGWKPSIHMPRWACRLLLDVTAVRIERLQDISEGDAIAEGIEPAPLPHPGSRHYQERDGLPGIIAVDSYKTLWWMINGRESWAANPRVIVYTFKPRAASQ